MKFINMATLQQASKSSLMKRRYYFPLKYADLFAQCDREHKGCQICQAVKPKTGPSHSTGDYVPIPEDIFSSLCMDFVDLEPSTGTDGKSYDCIFVIVCRLSGYIIAIPCQKKGLTANDPGRVVSKDRASFMGLPNEILSDNDKLICSNFFTRLCELAGIEQHSAIVYRPQGRRPRRKCSSKQ